MYAMFLRDLISVRKDDTFLWEGRFCTLKKSEQPR